MWLKEQESMKAARKAPLFTQQLHNGIETVFSINLFTFELFHRIGRTLAEGLPKPGSIWNGEMDGPAITLL